MPFPYSIAEINKRATGDPKNFACECEAIFNRKVDEAAASIAERAEAVESHVVFLSGPSGSGKTTTAQKICDALSRLGIHAHTVSLDKYYLTPDPETAPRTETGTFDLESPLCLDLELLKTQFNMLNNGEEVVIPHFNFATQTRDPLRAMRLKLQRDEIVIFEGIHALNDMLTSNHPNAFKLHISTRSNVVDNGEVCFKRTWMRLLRRVVRDERFRGTGVMDTLGMWGTVRRGEMKYITPFKYKADLLFDSSMEYEIPVMKRFALKAFGNIPEGMERSEQLRSLVPELKKFEDVDTETVPPNSVLREFIGGGIYKY